MADATDLKSVGSNPVRVRIPPSAPIFSSIYHNSASACEISESPALENSSKCSEYQFGLLTVQFWMMVPKTSILRADEKFVSIRRLAA
jgi:hypothetical protein